MLKMVAKTYYYSIYMSMPTLGDMPTLEKLTGSSLLSSDSNSVTVIARSDLLSFFDDSSKKVKSITVQDLGEALGLTFS